MSSMLINAEQIAALVDVGSKLITLLTEIHSQGTDDAKQAWADTVTEYQTALADWRAVTGAQHTVSDAPQAVVLTPAPMAERAWRT